MVIKWLLKTNDLYIHYNLNWFNIMLHLFDKLYILG